MSCIRWGIVAIYHTHEYVPDFKRGRRKKKSHILYNKNYCDVHKH